MIADATTPFPNRAAGRIEVSVLVMDRASFSDELVDQLQREVLHVDVADSSVLAAEPEESRAVVLVWVPPSFGAEDYARIVAWAKRAPSEIALLGCGPTLTGVDAETALAAGFDDFVAGRASARELAARVRALHRRIRGAGARRSTVHRFGRLVLDRFGYRLWVDGRNVSLTATELGVIGALIDARGQALSRAQILDSAWAENLEVGERAVDNVILRLRRKLGDSRVIETVRGVGFRIAS